jgi:hypothetical protein
MSVTMLLSSGDSVLTLDDRNTLRASASYHENCWNLSRHDASGSNSIIVV